MKALVLIVALLAAGCGTCSDMHALYRDARDVVIESGACNGYRDADCPALRKLQGAYYRHAPPCPTQ